jgi:hypothetical protein
MHPANTAAPMNARRAAWALLALTHFADVTGLDPVADDPHTALADLLADLRHLCDALDIDFAASDTHAYQHYCEDLADARTDGDPPPMRDQVLALAAQEAPDGQSEHQMVHLLIGADIPMPPHAAVASLACLFPTRDEQANLQRGNAIAYEQIALGMQPTVAVYYDPATVALGLLAGCLIACARHRVIPHLFVVDGQSYRSLM